ncbi:MAG: dATP/dGTP diphosphohydrolase domain-containing protein [Usitatibacter sp.]
MAVGDVNSNERGSGARFNDGKPPFELIPVRVISKLYGDVLVSDEPRARVVRCLQHLASWQETGEEGHIYDAMVSLGEEALIEATFVLEYGKKKYAAWNWAKGMPWSVCVACAVRHALAVLRGEQTDPESGRLHVGHIMCNLIFLATFVRTYPEGDDRPRCFEVAA